MSTATRGNAFRFAALLPLFLGCACGGPDSPVGPTPPFTVTAAQAPAPAPAFDLSPFVGYWDLDLRFAGTQGEGGCVAAAMQSQSGYVGRYSLDITPEGVTLSSAWGGYACTFAAFKTDSSSFTTYDVQAAFTCQPAVLGIQCSDGSVHELFSRGQNIAGRISGGEMIGTWDADWEVKPDMRLTSTKAQFAGTRR